MFLGVIISRLSEGDKSASIPYRESKLTRILQSSIGGNARTSIIVTVSPSASNVEHTVNSLRFGARAIRIQNYAQVNEIQADLAFISKHQATIDGLQRRLSSMSDSSDTSMSADKENQPSNGESEFNKRELEQQLANLQKFILNSHSVLTSTELSKKRRHTYGSTPFTQSTANSTDDSAFRMEQAQVASARISQLESLLSDLSLENTELLERENEHMASEEQMLQQIENLTSQMTLYTSGTGVDDMTLFEVTDMELRLQDVLKVVQRSMYRKQFMQEFADKKIPTISQQEIHEMNHTVPTTHPIITSSSLPSSSSCSSSSSSSSLSDDDSPSFIHNISSIMSEDNIEVKLEPFRDVSQHHHSTDELIDENEAVWNDQGVGSDAISALQKKLEEMQMKLKEVRR